MDKAFTKTTLIHGGYGENKSYDITERGAASININLAIIVCFKYSWSRDFLPMREKNVLTDLKNYIHFCLTFLRLHPGQIVVISDIDKEVRKFFPGTVIHCSSDNYFLSLLRDNITSLLSSKVSTSSQYRSKFYFFFSGHGAMKNDIGWLVLPTGREVSGRISSYQLMTVFSSSLPQYVDCFWFFDCCHSEKMVELPFRWSASGVKHRFVAHTLFHPDRRRIYSFHSSKKDEKSGFVAEGLYGSLFTYHCLSLLISFRSQGKAITFPHFLDKLKRRMIDGIKERSQPHHQPIYLTNQNSTSYPL